MGKKIEKNVLEMYEELLWRKKYIYFEFTDRLAGW
jgi:hypothetical protein